MRELRCQWLQGHGWSDYIRSVILLDQEFGDIAKITTAVDPAIQMGNVFDWSNEDNFLIPEERPRDAWHNWNGWLKHLTRLLLTNNSQVLNIDAVCHIPKDYNNFTQFHNCEKYKYLITPKEHWQPLIQDRCNSIVSGDYVVIHARVPDNYFGRTVADELTDKYVNKIEEVSEWHKEQNPVLVTSSVAVRDRVMLPKQRTGTPVHAGKRRNKTDDEILYWLTDIALLRGAAKIICIHAGNFGFSRTISYIENIPYESIRL